MPDLRYPTGIRPRLAVVFTIILAVKSLVWLLGNHVWWQGLSVLATLGICLTAWSSVIVDRRRRSREVPGDD